MGPSTWKSMGIVVLLVSLVLVVQHCLLIVYKSNDSTVHSLGKDHYLRRGDWIHSPFLLKGSGDSAELKAVINKTSHDRFHGDINHDSFIQKGGASLTRVAVIIVYIGGAFPSWFDAFCFSLQSSSPLFDYFFFVTEASIRQVPANVNIIRLTNEDLITRLTQLDDESHFTNNNYNNNDKNKNKEMFTAFQSLLNIEPYVLVEFKPCLGVLFGDYIKEYSHWAFADLDTLIGRAHSLVTPQILKKFDIYTASFGDNFRFYMRGQLTIHRNDPYINNLWRSCSHLSQINKRLKAFLEKGSTGWNFESAEGCYSRVISEHENVSVLIGSTQISDAFNAPLYERESFMLGNSILRCFEKGVFLHDNKDIARVTSFLVGDKPDYFGLSSSSSNNAGSDEVSSTMMVPLSKKDYQCLYWVGPEFQVCLDTVRSDVDITCENGGLHYFNNDRYRVLDHCREGSMSHFQGWKRNYYTATSQPPPLDSHLLLLSENGFIPLKIDSLGKSLTFAEIFAQHSHMGRVTSQDIELTAISGHASLAKGRGWVLPKLMGDTTAPQKRGGGSPGGDGFATAYCAGFSDDVKKCTCPILGSHIEIIQLAKDSGAVTEKSITLITAAWAQEFYSKSLDAMLDSWTAGPKIVVLARMDAELDIQVTSHRQDVTVIEVDMDSCAEKMNLISPEAPVLPDNVLFNVGLDASPTDLVCISPGGLIFESNPLAKAGFSHMSSSMSSPDAKAPAFVIPVFSPRSTLTEREALELEDLESIEITENSSEEDRLNAILFPQNSTDPVPYPPPGSFCGLHQSKKLFLSYQAEMKLKEEIEGQMMPFEQRKVVFNALEFLKEKTLMLPIVFSLSASPHGRGFVRLPEEMNGPGCFGSALLRIMAGAGYTLEWAPVVALEAEVEGAAEAHASQSSCGCIHGSDPNVLRGMASRMNSFYLRAVELRSTGISALHTSRPFGENFEEEQRHLLVEHRLKEKNA